MLRITEPVDCPSHLEIIRLLKRRQVHSDVRELGVGVDTAVRRAAELDLFRDRLQRFEVRTVIVRFRDIVIVGFQLHASSNYPEPTRSLPQRETPGRPLPYLSSGRAGDRRCAQGSVDGHRQISLGVECYRYLRDRAARTGLALQRHP